MKRNDSEIVSVKEWGSPRSNVQLFMPQEYCANCWEKVSLGNNNAGYYKFADIGIVGTCEKVDKINNNGYFANSVQDGDYPNVTFYALYDQNGVVKTSRALMPNSAYNHSYSGTFSADMTSYSFGSIMTLDIRIKSRNAYYKAHEAS